MFIGLGVCVSCGARSDLAETLASAPPDAGSSPGACPLEVVTTLAAGQDFPLAVAVDATTVYWANEGGDTIVKHTPK